MRAHGGTQRAEKTASAVAEDAWKAGRAEKDGTQAEPDAEDHRQEYDTGALRRP